MYSKKISLIILAITALVSSRLIFLFLSDSEGPNLLIVTVLAAIIYALSSAVYIPRILSSYTGGKRLAFVVLVQAILAVGFYVLMK